MNASPATTRSTASNHPTQSKLGYRPALDGLRGLAIVTVMAFHLRGFPLGQNGQIGVDVFFVLSGFLITTLLLEEWALKGGIDLASFYARRALRLFPALAAVLAACLLLILVSSVRHVPGTDPQKLHHLENGIAYSLIYATNWARAFGVDAGLLGHTWSLAIEEQFYLVWPPLLILLLRYGASVRRVALGLTAALIVLTAWRAVLWHGADLNRYYFGTDARADTLVVGSLLSCLFVLGYLPRSGQPKRLLGLGAAASAVFLAAVVLSRADFASPSYFAIYGGVEASAGVLIAGLIADPDGLIASLLSKSGLVWLGRLSYGLYLWHYPVFQAVAARNLVGWGFELTVAFALAVASLYLIERRFTALRHHFIKVGDRTQLSRDLVTPAT